MSTTLLAHRRTVPGYVVPLACVAGGRFAADHNMRRPQERHTATDGQERKFTCGAKLAQFRVVDGGVGHLPLLWGSVARKGSG